MEKSTKKIYEKPVAQDFRKMVEADVPEGLFVEGCIELRLCTAPNYTPVS